MTTTTWPRVPYYVGGAVWDEQRFAGRKQLLETLRDFAADPTREGFILSGPRRWGKSSVLERFARSIGFDARVVKLDLLSLLSHSEKWPEHTVVLAVLQETLDALEEDLGPRLPPRARQMVAVAPDAFDAATFRRLALPDLVSAVAPERMVILIDEMEVAEARDPMAPTEIASALLPLQTSRGPKPFMGVVWGRASGRGQSRDVPSRWKDFYLEELKLFSEEELQEALQKPVKGFYLWGEDALRLVWELTSGHPLFTAAIGAAVHAKKADWDAAEVLASDVDGVLEGALEAAHSWEDAWQQLTARQQMLLRVVAESPGIDLEEAASIIRRWGVLYKRSDFEPLLPGLIQDKLLDAKEGSGLNFPVKMVGHWVGRVHPSDILASREDRREGISIEAEREEQEGRRHYERGDLEEAARSFRAALDMDAARWSAAVWLGQVLMLLDRPEEAAAALRGAAPHREVTRVRAQVLALCLKRVLERRHDPTPWLLEFRTVDPHYQEAPQALPLVAEVQVEQWWRLLQENPSAADSVEATDRYVLALGAYCVKSALGRARDAIQSALEGQTALQEVSTLILHVLPHLLRESEPDALLAAGSGAEEAGDGFGDFASSWVRCYAAEVSALVRLGQEMGRVGPGGIPPASLLRLLECRTVTQALGGPLRELILTIVTEDHLAALSTSDAAAARGAAALLEQVDPAEGIHRLERAYNNAVYFLSVEDAGQLAAALRALPILGLVLVRLLQRRGQDHDVAAGYLSDILTRTGYLVECLEVDRAAIRRARAEQSPEEWERRWAEWAELLSATRSVEMTEARRLEDRLRELLLPAPEGDPIPDFPPPTGGRVIDALTITSILGSAYTVENKLKYPIVGVPPGYVWAWRVKRNGQYLLARAYRVEGGEPSVQALLEHLWENERRLLSTLATRWEGRSLPRLHVSRFEPEQKALVLVTDLVGPQTLRDLLKSGDIARVRRTSRSALWRHLQGIIEGLAALHRAGYIHRAVRPEHIMADSDSRSSRGGQWLYLTNFEWSVYLYGIASSQAPEVRLRDRYVAPEILALYRNPSDVLPYRGEGTVSDAFAVGLVLFECLVEPLHSEELMQLPASYGVKEHQEWIEQLLRRVDEARREEILAPPEVHILKKLLEPNPTRRRGSLDSILEEIATLTRQDLPEQAARLDSPLPLVTMLDIDTPTSIARFIREDLPDKEFKNTDDIGKWIQEQLEGATVWPNRRASAPLLLEGKDLNFTVQPFVFRGMEHRHIGWLKVAKEHDGPAGAAVGPLPNKVAVQSYRRDMTLGPLLSAPNSWAPLFSAVERLHEGLAINERAFIERIRWSIELERAAWYRQVLPYKRVEYIPGGRPGEPDLVLIEDDPDPHKRKHSREYKLVDLMAQSVDRDNVWFELGNSEDPTAAFDPDRRWIQVESDTDEEPGRIRLKRFRREGAVAPPDTGWIRPFSLAGSRTIYERRKKVLADVEGDPFLVRSLLTPNQTFEDLNLKPSRVFNPHLDEDKKALSIAIQNRHPLFIVQGPPGTGKTTLAAEVILRTLNDQPSSRILVVAQAHDPLNNLLDRVEEALDNWKIKARAARRPTSVRLTSEERLDERRYGREGTRVPRKYHPSRVAAEIMERASRWEPSGEEDVGEKAYNAWRRLYLSQELHGLSRSLERRLVDSANLVYATTNDRRLATMLPGSFDFVIYEEAAKALPAEVLGPLRLARRWLLIGDQAQLPPFGLEDIDDALKRDIIRFKFERRHGRLTAADKKGVDPLYILGEGVPSKNIWADIDHEMTQLLRFFNYIYQRAAAVPLTNTSLEKETGAAGSVKGLSGILATQWRMHPTIGDFVSKCFYQGRVRNGDRLADRRRHKLDSPPGIRGQSIVWLDIPHVGEQPLATDRRGFGGGWENGFEARVVLGFLRELLIGTKVRPSMAIMSPYRAQISVLAKLMKDYRVPGIADLLSNLHTADSFQGKQADMVVVSLVRNNMVTPGRDGGRTREGIGFLLSPERSTVIFSRAEKLLVVVGCIRHFKKFRGTPMHTVVSEVETLAAQPDSGVVILQGQVFLEPRHWEDLEDYHERYQIRRRQQRERDQRRRLRGELGSMRGEDE